MSNFKSTRKILSFILAMVMALGVFAISPVTARAATPLLINHDTQGDLANEITAALTTSGLTAADITGIDIIANVELTGDYSNGDWSELFNLKNTLPNVSDLTITFTQPNSTIPDHAMNTGYTNTSNGWLKQLTLKTGGSGTLISIGEDAFCYWPIITVDASAAVGPLTIKYNAFGACASLANAAFPSAIFIGNSAFGGCPLAAVSFPNVTDIGVRAFANNTSLTSAVFLSVTRIRQQAFDGCTNLANLTLLANPLTIDNADAFSGVPNTAGGPCLTVRTLPTNYSDYVTLRDTSNLFPSNTIINSLYPLTVNSGTIDATSLTTGLYAQGELVAITANAAPSGQVFDNWTSNAGGTFADPNSATTNFTMPAANVTVTANYVYTKALISVAGQNTSTLATTGIQGSPVTGTVSVANSVANLALADIVHTGASMNLYSDSGFSAEITGMNTLALTEGGATHAYIKVTPGSGGEAYYDITINRAAATATPAITNVTANPITIGSSGGASTITVSGTSLTTETITVMVFDGANPTSITATRTDAGTVQLTFPANSSTTADKTYTIKASLDGGTTWATQTASVTVSRASGGGYTPPDNNDGDSYTPPVIWNIQTDKQPNLPKTAALEQSGTVKNNRLTATITKEMVQAALDKAGTDPDGIALIFNFTAGTKFTSQTINFTADALDLLKSSGVKYVQAGTSMFRWRFDDKAIAQLDAQTTGQVSVNANPANLGSAAKKLIVGPAFDVTVQFKRDGKTWNVVSLGSGKMTRWIAYKLAAGQNAGSIAAVYVDKDGKASWIDGSVYENGWLSWTGSSCSVYGVGLKTPAPAFTDTSGHWAKDYIDFAVSRGYMSGTSSMTFAPNTVITRGMFITALGRLSGVDVSGYKTSSFSDVKADSYYLPYIEWAVANKIVNGVGGGRFAPDSPIAREDMAVMMVNFAKALNYTLPVALEAFKFTDANSIASGAKDAVTAMQQAGVIAGKSGGKFDPKGNLTRAEACTVLQRYAELVIDPAGTRGWRQNDSGEWMYYGLTTGKLLTGWQDIGGAKYYFDSKGIMQAEKWLVIDGKSYYFYDDGKLAVSTTIDGYTVGADGARK